MRIRPILWLIMLAGGLSLAGCAADEESFRLLGDQGQANRFVNQVVYIKDPSTNLCYAYYWGGGYNGGPSFTLVPEDSIPPDRLIVGQPNQ